jgi:hypothetical protein
MHFVFVILVVTVFADISYGVRAIKIVTELPHPRYSTVGNPYILPEYDCALRAFGIEMAAYQSPSSAKPFKTAPEMAKEACHHTVFVHDAKGNDLFDETFERPVKTIQTALSLTRTLRAVYNNDSTLCINIRGGTYYLGTNATTSSSQIDAIAIASNDSNLVIENYQDERVVLSGGTLLHLQWTAFAKTAASGTIMKAQVPLSVNLDQFNELYIDDRRAAVAKYPNGDPATQGLYATDPEFSYHSQSWVPPSFSSPDVDIRVQEPNRSGTSFPNYHRGLGGGASVFNPPHSYWGTTHAVPGGLTVKNGALPHFSNWSKPTTGFVHAFHGDY